jgi:hypothetical protein
MSIPGFGNIMPIHGEVLALIGWRISRGGSRLITSRAERLQEMRRGHANLVRNTGHDFGYDLAKWRAFLVAHDKEYGYRHPYAFASVERAVKAAIADPDFLQLAELAAIGDMEWQSKYNAKIASERHSHLDAIAAKDALITTNVCSFCEKPCPSYRVTCKHCGNQLRERR